MTDFTTHRRNPPVNVMDAVRDLLLAAMQEHQDYEGRLRDDQHYHCGGSCAVFILDTPSGRKLAEQFAYWVPVASVASGRTSK